MKLHLNSFEQEIDSVILDRGYKYFRKNAVVEYNELPGGKVEAIVAGSENYSVQLTIGSDESVEHVCSCPYDLGPVCKHVAAVIFYMKQTELGIKPSKKKTTDNEQKKTRKTHEEKIRELLEVIPPDQLKDFIAKQCLIDRSLKQAFMLSFETVNQAVSEKSCKNIVRSILVSAGKSRGYIDYSAGNSAAVSIRDFMNEGVNYLVAQHYTEAFYVSTAIIEEVVAVFGFTDDSSGALSTCVDEAFELLQQISSDADDGMKRKIYQHCVSVFKNKKLAGWDWHYDMLKVAVELIHDEKDFIEIQSILEKIISEERHSYFGGRHAQSLMVILIKKHKGEKAALQYLKDNADNPEFRRQLIKLYLDNNDLDDAFNLITEGIQHDKKDSPGLADEWKHFLLHLYLIKKDPESIVRIARELFVDSIHEKKFCFEVLKNHIPSNEWSDYVDRLIVSIKEKSRYFCVNTVADIYVWEERWTDLLALIQKHVCFELLDGYASYLLPVYPGETANLYQKAIMDFMEENVSRKNYQKVCRYLRRMIKSGAREKVDEIIRDLKKLYPTRKALLEELKLV